MGSHISAMLSQALPPRAPKFLRHKLPHWLSPACTPRPLPKLATLWRNCAPQPRGLASDGPRSATRSRPSGSPCARRSTSCGSLSLEQAIKDSAGAFPLSLKECDSGAALGVPRTARGRLRCRLEEVNGAPERVDNRQKPSGQSMTALALRLSPKNVARRAN